MTEIEKTQLVQDCQTLEELKECFKKIEPIKGSQKEYSAEKLSEKVDLLSKICVVENCNIESIHWNLITRTHGIRAKLMELIYYTKKGI